MSRPRVSGITFTQSREDALLDAGPEAAVAAVSDPFGAFGDHVEPGMQHPVRACVFTRVRARACVRTCVFANVCTCVRAFARPASVRLGFFEQTKLLLPLVAALTQSNFSNQRIAVAKLSWNAWAGVHYCLAIYLVCGLLCVDR